MLVRPNFADAKYQNLDINERIIQADRDALLYDILNNQTNKTTINFNNNNNNNERTINSYYKNLKTVMKNDEKEYNNKTNYIKQLKKQYAILKYKKDIYKTKLRDAQRINPISLAVISMLPVLLLIIFTSDLKENAFEIITLILSVIFSGILYDDLIKIHSKFQINRIDNKLHNIRKELKSRL